MDNVGKGELPRAMQHSEHSIRLGLGERRPRRTSFMQSATPFHGVAKRQLTSATAKACAQNHSATCLMIIANCSNCWRSSGWKTVAAEGRCSRVGAV